MIDEKELRFFKRYLKEKKVYFSFLRDCNITQIRFGKCHKRKLQDAIKGGYGKGQTVNLIMDCILWSAAEYNNWSMIYTDYYNYFYKEYENFKKDYSVS